MIILYLKENYLAKALFVRTAKRDLRRLALFGWIVPFLAALSKRLTTLLRCEDFFSAGAASNFLRSVKISALRERFLKRRVSACMSLLRALGRF